MRPSLRSSLAFAAIGAAALIAFPHGIASAAVEPNAGPDSEPFPITIEVKPSTALPGTAIALTGTTLALLNSDVVLTIAAPRSNPPQLTKLPATRSADGSFNAIYVPKVAGTYTVDAMAPDGLGHATASFTIENPRQLSPATTQALADLSQDAGEIVHISRKQLDNIPPSPARDEARQKLDTLTQSIGQLIEVSQQMSGNLGTMIPATAGLPPPSPLPSGNTPAGPGAGNMTVGGNYTMGGDGSVAGNMQVTLSKLSADRQAVVEMLGQASQAHQRSQAEIQKLKKEQLTCDNLEKVAEGIKLVSVMFNFMSGGVGIVKNFAKDFAAAAVSDQIKSRTGSPFGGFLGGETLKNVSIEGEKNARKLQVNLNNAASITNDVFGFLTDRVMNAYCELFTGPVTAHMHATFTDDGVKWWEYSFDVRGQLNLHYPKGASGGSVPLKGRIEGFATNYKVWDNALTVKFPGLMSSAVQKHAYILPFAPADTQTGLFKKISSVEGSIFGNLVTPSSFMFEVNGTATADQLNIVIGPQNIDTDNKARAIVLYAAVLSLSLGYEVYSLPYKPVHFVFERASGTYTIPLSTKNKVVRGKQHFTNHRAGAGTMGDYTVDIEACNPDC